jgi:hypothetical protein
LELSDKTAQQQLFLTGTVLLFPSLVVASLDKTVFLVCGFMKVTRLLISRVIKVNAYSTLLLALAEVSRKRTL